MEFKSLSELAKFINKESSKVLQQKESNVKNVVVHEFIDQIDDKIYNQYDPRMYERLRDNGGLTDRDNFEANPEGSGVAISSNRKGFDRSGSYVNVLEIIEGNKKYSIEDVWGYGFEEPRHAVRPTVEALRNNGNLKKGFKLDMEDHGFIVE